MTRIMVIEDDAELNRPMCVYLENIGYRVRGCMSADEALNEMYHEHFDLILSDIMLPGKNGIELAQMIRSLDEDIPIMFITARDDMDTMKKSYRSGVDEYMIKPVDFEELALRIGALLRRTKIAQSNEIKIGSFTLNANERAATLGDEEIPLTNREFNLLFKLLSYPKKTFSRSQLMDEFWDMDSSASLRAVDVYMTKLRSKFEGCSEFEIKTVRGLGYKAVLNQ